VAIGEDLGLKSLDLAREESIWRARNRFGGKSMIYLALGKGKRSTGSGRRETGKMKRRLLARIGLEDDVCFSYAVLQPGEENSARSVISLLTWLFSDDVDFLSAGLQLISILAQEDAFTTRSFW